MELDVCLVCFTFVVIGLTTATRASVPEESNRKKENRTEKEKSRSSQQMAAEGWCSTAESVSRNSMQSVGSARKLSVFHILWLRPSRPLYTRRPFIFKLARRNEVLMLMLLMLDNVRKMAAGRRRNIMQPTCIASRRQPWCLSQQMLSRVCSLSWRRWKSF